MLQTTFSLLNFEYKRPAVDSLKLDLNELILKIQSSDSSEMALKLLQSYTNLNANFNTMANLAHIRNSVNTNDPFYEEEMVYLNQVSPELEELKVQFNKALLNSPFVEDLKDYYGDHFIKTLELKVKILNSSIVELAQKENNLTFEYQKLLGKAKFEFRGEDHNLSSLSPLMQSKDRATRKEANALYWSFYQEHQEQLRTIYDELVQIRHQMALELGYENFVQMGYDRMERTDYTYKEVQQFRNSILECAVPLLKELAQAQKERLGLSDYKYYDAGLNYLTGNPIPKGGVDELVEKAREMYHQLSPETGSFFEMMIQEDLMDLDTKAGKQPGGYCTSLPILKKPFIFANFNATDHDVVVLTHEAGHAFQYYSSAHAISNSEFHWSTAELAEVHSMSMESLTLPWMHHFFEKDTTKFKHGHCIAAFSLLIRCCILDEFQEVVYTQPQLTAQEREALYKSLLNKYGQDTDYDGVSILEQGGAWYRVMHLFFGPFYYIDYALAQVCAFQFQKLSEEDFDYAIKKYIYLCQLGGSYSFTTTLKEIGLNSPFDKKTIQDLVIYIKKYLSQLCEELV